MRSWLVPGLLLFALSPLAAAAEGGAREVTVPSFGNATCPAMPSKAAKPDKFVEKDGERIHVCCSKCQKKVAADFEKYKELAYPADAVKRLDNPRCPIMGGKAKSGVSIVFQGRQVNFCCSGCEKKFLKDPQRHLALLEDPTLVDLENRKCLVMPDEETAPGLFFVYDGVLIRSCCDDCKEEFAADPEKYLKQAKVDLAMVKAKAAKERAAAEKDAKEGSQDEG